MLTIKLLDNVMIMVQKDRVESRPDTTSKNVVWVNVGTLEHPVMELGVICE